MLRVDTPCALVGDYILLSTSGSSFKASIKQPIHWPENFIIPSELMKSSNPKPQVIGGDVKVNQCKASNAKISTSTLFISSPKLASKRRIFVDAVWWPNRGQ